MKYDWLIFNNTDTLSKFNFSRSVEFQDFCFSPMGREKIQDENCTPTRLSGHKVSVTSEATKSSVLKRLWLNGYIPVHLNTLVMIQ